MLDVAAAELFNAGAVVSVLVRNPTLPVVPVLGALTRPLSVLSDVPTAKLCECPASDDIDIVPCEMSVELVPRLVDNAALFDDRALLDKPVSDPLVIAIVGLAIAVSLPVEFVLFNGGGVVTRSKL